MRTQSMTRYGVKLWGNDTAAIYYSHQYGYSLLVGSVRHSLTLEDVYDLRKALDWNEELRTDRDWNT